MVKNIPKKYFFILGFFFILSGSYFLQTNLLPERLKPFDAAGLYDFSSYKNLDAYLRAYRKKIAALHPGLSDRVLENLTPLPFRPEETVQCAGTKKIAILTIHGFSDSPFVFSDIHKELKRNCHPIYSIILPGHGLSPGALRKVDEKDWHQAVYFAMTHIQKEQGDFITMGYSTGALLGLNTALENKKGIAPSRIILFNPVFAIHNLGSLAFLLHPLSVFSDIFPYFGWENKRTDAGPYKYNSTLFKSALHIHKTIKRQKALTQRYFFDGEMFLVITEKDQTVDAQESIDYAKKFLQEKDSVLIYNASSSSYPFRAHTELFDAKDDRLKTIDASHLSVLISPENAYWGGNPQETECSHYAMQPEKLQKCKEGSDYVSGEITKKNIETFPILRRATFNPRFSEQWKYIKNFIDTGQIIQQ